MFKMQELKFKTAESEHDCCEPNKIHTFSKIESKELIDQIRDQKPELEACLWMCDRCAKIIESY